MLDLDEQDVLNKLDINEQEQKVSIREPEKTISALSLLNLLFENAQYKKVYMKDDPIAKKFDTSHKAPIDNKLYTYNEIKDWNKRIGWVVPKGYTVVDIDDVDIAKRVKKILMSESIDTIIFDSEHGSHFVFQSIPGIFQTQDSFCRLGIKIDIRSNESGYIIIPHNDADRKIYTISQKIPKIPQYLKVEKSELIKMNEVDEGGRNGKLFEFMVKLKALPDINIDDIKQCVTLCNQFILKKPISDKELLKTVLSEKNLERGIVADKISSNTIALQLLEELKILTTRQGMYMFNGKYYQICDPFDVNRYIHSRYQELGKDKRAEVFEFIRLKTFRDAEDINSDWRKITMRNGVLNLLTGELKDFSPDELITRYLDVEFLPLTRETTSGRIDAFLDGLSGNDYQKKQKLLEFIGYCLVSRNKFQKIFFLLGPGATGKSTFLELIRRIFSPSNCSALSMSDLEQQFMPIQLKDKLLNIGDDISMNTLLDGAVIKVICGTMPIMVQQKYGTPFELVNECKFIFSCNKMPLFKDKTDGLSRRLEIIEITNRVAPSNRNTNILDTFTHEDKQYLIYQAFLAINLALKNDRLIDAVCCAEALEKFRTTQSTVLTYLKQGNTNNFRKSAKELAKDNILSVDNYIGRSTNACYVEYTNYCISTGKKHSSFENFKDIICFELSLDEVDYRFVRANE